jgi:RimJ/RimL family protein N-acetyltransferase
MKILETESLYLREYKGSDLESLAGIYSDEEVMKYIGRGGIVSIEQTQKGIDGWRNKYYPDWGFGIWALIEKENDLLIGHCGFNILKENSEVEIAYLLAKEYWGKGYATEISRAAPDYGFTDLNLSRIVALAYPENIASINVIHKLGMKLDGEEEFFGKKFLYFTLERNIC